MMKIGVIGCGNVGLNTMKAFAAKEHEVIGYDVSLAAQQRIVQSLGPAALSMSLEPLTDCDVVFECVPTDPVDDTGACDLSLLETTVRAFAALEVQPHYKCRLFVQRSTCPPGTASKLASQFNKTLYAVNPSFLRKKTQWEDSISPERVAIGGSLAAIELLKLVYQSFSSPFFVSENYEVVELLKYFENIVDAVLISLWNEFLTISDHLGVPRVEFSRLIDCMPDRDKFRSVVRVPGQAFGMWCLPKDIAAIAHAFGSLDINVIKAAEATNVVVRELFGENQNSSTEMFVFQEGQLKLTNLGYTYLNTTRKINGDSDRH